MVVVVVILVVSIYVSGSITASFVQLNKSGAAAVGGDVYIKLFPDGLQEGVKTIKLTPSLMLNQEHRISVIIQSCSSTLPTKPLTLHQNGKHISSSSAIKVKTDPLYTVGKGYVEYAVNGTTTTALDGQVGSPRCLVKSVVFRDYSKSLKYISETETADDDMNEYCLYNSPDVGMINTRMVLLNDTGFYFIVLFIVQTVSLDIYQEINLNVYDGTDAVNKACTFNDVLRTCTVGLADHPKDSCIYVQSDQYFNLLYYVTYTDLFIGLVAASVMLLLMLSVAIGIAGFMCCLIIHQP
jgi:hypothetical protein